MYIIIDDERSMEQVNKLCRLPRTKETDEWHICRSYKGFISLLESLKEGQVPTFVSFDHDLGHEPSEGETEKTGLSCARAMIQIAIDKKWAHLPKCAVHSQNPVGRNNIVEELKSGERWVGGGKPSR